MTRDRLTAVTPLKVISVGVLVMLVVSELVISGSLFAQSTLSTILAPLSILIVIAIGQALVIGTGGIDLSVPATVTLTGVIILKASEGKDSGLLKALLIVAGACIVIGLVNGLLVEGLRLNALVVTLATGQLILGFMRLYGGELLPASEVPPQLSAWTADDIVGGVSYLFVIAAVVAVLGTLFLQRFVQGRRLVASSASERSAFLAGIAARRYRILAYVLGSLCYGLGGVLASGDVGTPDLTLGDPYLLLSIVAVILGGAAVTGGRASPIATMLGAIFIFLLDYDLRVKGVSGGLREAVQGAVLVLGLSLVFLIQNMPTVRAALARLRGGSSLPSDQTGAA
ncbi:MAG TPA: ABC transporter permease [Solirubrobacterales bacterium]|nr:ABC transporter permease [Solirubrobacterales bacterium]